MSKPLHQPTEKTRAEISFGSYGLPIKEVAAYIGIDDKTLYNITSDELENSAKKCKCKKFYTKLQAVRVGNRRNKWSLIILILFMVFVNVGDYATNHRKRHQRFNPLLQ